MTENQFPPILYHYTTQEGLLGIIHERALWASSIRHLNDSEEFAYAAGLVKELVTPKIMEAAYEVQRFYGFVFNIIDSLDEDASHAVASFSERGDSLSQWRAYTQGGIGFSIGFETGYLLNLAMLNGFLLSKCTYDDAKHRKTIQDLLEESEPVKGMSSQQRANWFAGQFYSLAAAFKNESFREEEEWRLVGPLFKGDVKTRFRAGKSMLVPYILFAFPPDQPLKIARIVVGPTPHSELSMLSLRRLLAANKIEGTTVEASRVPYRSW